MCAHTQAQANLCIYAVLAFTSPEKSLVMGDPAYEAPMRAASYSKARVFKVPLAKNYAHDVKAMVGADPNAVALHLQSQQSHGHDNDPRRH